MNKKEILFGGQPGKVMDDEFPYVPNIPSVVLLNILRLSVNIYINRAFNGWMVT